MQGSLPVILFFLLLFIIVEVDEETNGLALQIVMLIVGGLVLLALMWVGV